MFDYIKGLLTAKNFPYCTIECNNIGYLLLVNYRTIQTLPELNSEVKIYLKLIHKEDSMILCGFNNKQDRIIFDILTSVSGIGTKVAFALLDEFETNELINAVIEQDYKSISRTKGIGPKMAQKIVLEIKDKLTKMDMTAELISSKTKYNDISNETITQAITVLQSLGYDKNEYQSAIETALSALKKDDAQELIKETLKILSIF